ncbi:DUF4279 domain-containing protein [Hymenobacter lucidus]|uniref:DUF4279 domain-containing protein n=1 Tax=Hymenobacter lucidus TaxID=2880930 RepID=A0ABS8AWY3_9BACT|nr:DUF4279 domain-containing protein [Hymenobacter lucidus]MCB2410299.1 DUF4279 domain-containing protein [Hymenobacter lucidus]
MSASQSYVYFSLQGADFDPDEVTTRLGITPTKTWRKGDQKSYGIPRQNTAWIWETARGTEPIWINTLVDEVLSTFEAKADIIMELKHTLQLESMLCIILYIDRNEDESTPSVGHDLRTISFLYHTQTTTDIDMYHYNSAENELTS